MKQLHVDLEDKDFDTLRDWSNNHGHSLTWTVRQALNNFMRVQGIKIELKHKNSN